MVGKLIDTREVQQWMYDSIDRFKIPKWSLQCGSISKEKSIQTLRMVKRDNQKPYKRLIETGFGKPKRFFVIDILS